MEGLIPFVIHAIKKNRERNQYQCLPNGSHTGSMKSSFSEWDSADEGLSHHRRALSELPPMGSDFFVVEERTGGSQSLKEDTSSVSYFSTITRANKHK
jgi:hypothetical protein